MRIMTSVPPEWSFVFESLREDGHELIELDHYEVLTADVIDTYERERPDVFFWNPGAPIWQSFTMVEHLLGKLGHPPTVLVTVMPKEWAEYCSEKLPRVQVARMQIESYGEALAAAVAAKAT